MVKPWMTMFILVVYLFVYMFSEGEYGEAIDDYVYCKLFTCLFICLFIFQKRNMVKPLMTMQDLMELWIL